MPYGALGRNRRCEASRYIGSRFGRELRITTIRIAQVIVSVIFVAFVVSVLILFVQVETDFDATAIFTVSEEVGDLMPWLILLAAIGSETSAIINATMSRSDMLVENRLPRRWTFIVLLVPPFALFLFVEATQAVALAKRWMSTTSARSMQSRLSFPR